MPGNPKATLYISNLDDRVDERLLYEIMVQAGPLVDVYIPRDKGTQKHKGYGFAEYRSEESAEYALTLFTGLVSLYKRLVRFSISGGDKTLRVGDKAIQPVDIPNNNMNNVIYDSPETCISQHLYPHSSHNKFNDIYRHSPILSGHQSHVHPTPNFAQGPVYGNPNALSMASPIMNTTTFAQHYNSQISILGQQALRTQAYIGHPHAHSSY